MREWGGLAVEHVWQGRRARIPMLGTRSVYKNKASEFGKRCIETAKGKNCSQVLRYAPISIAEVDRAFKSLKKLLPFLSTRHLIIR